MTDYLNQSKLDKYFSNVNKILDLTEGGCIWLGDYTSAKDKDFLKDNNIQVIINCTIDLDFTEENLIKIRIPLEDDEQEILYFERLMPMGAELINNFSNKNILVHCFAGMNRSATIIAAYLINYKNMYYKEAIKFILEKRSPVFTSDYLHNILENY